MNVLGRTTIYIGDAALTVSYSGYHLPAKTSGPWEDCYPEEGELNLDSVVLQDGRDITDKLNQRYTDKLIEACWEDHAYSH